jgi:hypothetical protein
MAEKLSSKGNTKVMQRMFMAYIDKYLDLLLYKGNQKRRKP